MEKEKLILKLILYLQLNGHFEAEPSCELESAPRAQPFYVTGKPFHLAEQYMFVSWNDFLFHR